MREITGKLSLELEAKIAAEFVFDENYWKRRCIEQFTLRNCQIRDHGLTWKQLFFETYLQQVRILCRLWFSKFCCSEVPGRLRTRSRGNLLELKLRVSVAPNRARSCPIFCSPCAPARITFSHWRCARDYFVRFIFDIVDTTTLGTPWRRINLQNGASHWSQSPICLISSCPISQSWKLLMV